MTVADEPATPLPGAKMAPLPTERFATEPLPVSAPPLIVVVPPDHKWARRSAPMTAAELRQTPLVSRKSGWRLLLGTDEAAEDDADDGALQPCLYHDAHGRRRNIGGSRQQACDIVVFCLNDASVSAR